MDTSNQNREDQLAEKISGAGLEHQESEQGASMLEYALLAALIAVVCILAITFLGRQACISFSRVGSSMNVANG